MKKNKTDYMLGAIAIFLLIFVVTLLTIFVVTGSIPDTLCTCVFGACTGEFGAMAWIKTTKEKHRERQEFIEDRAWTEEHRKGEQHESGDFSGDAGRSGDVHESGNGGDQESAEGAAG